MRKTISVVLAVILLFTMGFAVTGCGSKTDYDSPVKAVEAHQSGTNIVGKTVKVTATMDYTAIRGAGGVIYFQTSPSTFTNIYVCPNEGSRTDIKKDQTVTFKITNVDDHLVSSIYLEGEII